MTLRLTTAVGLSSDSVADSETGKHTFFLIVAGSAGGRGMIRHFPYGLSARSAIPFLQVGYFFSIFTRASAKALPISARVLAQPR
jgi:hypothetical protein